MLAILAADANDFLDLPAKAGAESGWIAMALVLMVMGALGLFAFFLRGDKAEARETQRFIRNEMADVIDGNTIVVGRFLAVMRERPCLHDSDLKRLEGGNGLNVGTDEEETLDAATKKAVARVKTRERRRQAARDEDSGG